MNLHGKYRLYHQQVQLLRQIGSIKAIGKRYQVKFNSDDAANRDTFGCVRNLAAYVAKMRPDAAAKGTT